MKLITVQPAVVTHKLSLGQRVYGDPDFDLDDETDRSMRVAYDWLVKQMAARIGPMTVNPTWPPSPHRGSTAKVLCYPMWAWAVPPEGVEAFLPIETAEGDTILHLEVPDHMVVCTDYDMWHHVLNNNEIQLYEDEVIDKEESWQRIFGVDPKAYRYVLESKDRNYMSLDAPPTIQATMWYFDPQWITKTEPQMKGL
jgi:hypothetical protein